MRYVSLFSGVEAASVAWSRLGWEPVAFAEVDEFPAAVLAHRFPGVPNLGDVCKVDWKEFYERYGAVDVVVGGSPCQSFSIAGNRTGLEGASGLMWQFCRAIRELVEASGGAGPRYVLWENVPGALSSGPKGQKGEDFGCLLRELADCGYGLAWRVLDSQFARVPDGSAHGFAGPVPQRRRRVFLVGSLGTDGAGDILFERTCLRGDYPKGREAREALAGDSAQGSGMGYSAAFKWFMGGKAHGIGYEENQSPTLSVSDSHVPAVHYGFCGYASGTAGSIGFGPVSMTLKAGDGFQSNVPTVLSFVGDNGGNTAMGMSENVSPCMSAKHAPSVMAVRTANTNANGCGIAKDVTHTLDGANGQCVAIEQPIVCAADDNGKAAIE